MNENSPFSPSPSTGGAPTPSPFGGFGTPRAASPQPDSPDALTEGLNPQQLEAVTHSGSPLLIVARNGLPLPVETSINFSGPADARLHVPGVLRIPARGSVTVQMTADLPESSRSTDLNLYLASANGQPISQPVDISVRTTRITVGRWLAIAALVLAGLLVVIALRGARGSPPASSEREPQPSRRKNRRTK